MHISRKAEYALRALTAMARKPLTATSQIEELAAAERIPVKFLEQILLTLRRAGILKSRRGVGGGYQLERPASRTTLGEILTAIDGPIQPMSCTPPEPGRPGKAVCDCGTPGGCGVGKIFTDLQTQIHAYLSSQTLSDALAREATSPAMQFEI
ncbi:MAG TPA: Rrf2 family transcriptional regulator [Verrucomicrobiales bacterium]|jgi:Rrf2 family protein|nr:Rrf2 family transcriptional regulator [Verrucomicrobiales bacterium]